MPADAKFALQTPVTVGELENQLYPITKGLEANQMVATTNLLNLKQRLRAQVQIKAQQMSASFRCCHQTSVLSTVVFSSAALLSF